MVPSCHNRLKSLYGYGTVLEQVESTVDTLLLLWTNLLDIQLNLIYTSTFLLDKLGRLIKIH
jgi:hypothetical protein